MQAGPGPQEVQEGEGEVVDPLQAESFPTHRNPFFSEGKGKRRQANSLYSDYSSVVHHIFFITRLFIAFRIFQVQKLKDRQFGRVQLFVPHKNPPATIGTYMYIHLKHKRCK